MAHPRNLTAARTGRRRKPSVHTEQRISVCTVLRGRRLGGIFVICILRRGHVFCAGGEVEVEFAGCHEGGLGEGRFGSPGWLREEEGLGVWFAEGRHGFLLGGVEGAMGACFLSVWRLNRLVCSSCKHGSRTLLLVLMLHAELVEWGSDIARSPGLPFKVHRTFSGSFVHLVRWLERERERVRGRWW